MPSTPVDDDKLTSLVELMEKVSELKKAHWKETAAIKRLQKIVKKSSLLVEHTNSSAVVALDAKLLHAGSELVSSNVTSFETNLTSFNVEEYTNGILSYLRANSDGESTDKSWQCFAPATYNLYRKSDAPVFMIGSLTFAPEPVRQKVRVERMKKDAGSKLLLSDYEGPQNQNDEIEDSIYENILKSLVRCYKSNDKKPVNFIEFILNPDSYWSSIQNIFYFSFLVRDGRVKMSVNDDGLPIVEPIFGIARPAEKQAQGQEKRENKEKDKDNDKDKGKSKNNQFIFTLNMKQWKNCIQKFKITSAMIKPIQKK